MTKSPTTQRVVPRLVLLSALLVSCVNPRQPETTYDGPPSAPDRGQTSAIGPVNNTLYVVAKGMQYDGQWDTPLPSGVSSNPEVFRSRLANTSGLPRYIRWRAATCRYCAVRVRISTITRTGIFDPTPAPSSPKAVAHLENLGNAVEAYYGLKPDDEADYYFWVDSTAGDSTRMTVIEVPRSHGLVRAGRQKTVKHCHRHAPDSTRADADFLEYRPPCTEPGFSMPGTEPGYRRTGERNLTSVSEASLFSAAGLMNLLKRAAPPLPAISYSLAGWIDCNSGCCA